jgi:creatinine amidohydrolase
MPRPILHLAQLTYEEAAAALAEGAVALLPIGSTEAHGPHLPLDTDVILSETAAVRAAERLHERGRVRALVLPSIAYTVTDFAAGFGGTLSLPADAVGAYLREVVLAALRAGFRAVVLSSAHLEPGHLAVLHAVVDALRAEGHPVAFPDLTRRPHALRLGEEFRSGACHAGRYETSLVLAADPFRVRDGASDLPANPASLSRAIRDGKRTFEEAGGPRAYFGDPAAASAAEGDEIYHVLADILATAALEMLGGDLARGEAGSAGTAPGEARTSSIPGAGGAVPQAVVPSSESVP